MRKGLLFLISVILAALATRAQSPPIIVAPQDGTAFTDGQTLCFSAEAPSSSPLTWVLWGPLANGTVFSPYFSSLDDRFCFPGDVRPWDSPASFSLQVCGTGTCSSTITCSMEPSQSQAPPLSLELSEVSFRKKKSGFFLRLVIKETITNAACLELSLGGRSLALSKCEVVGDSTLIEAKIGSEGEFVQSCAGPPEILLRDSCSGSEFHPPALPNGKVAEAYCMIVYNAKKGRVLHLGSWWTPLTGCEVVFFSWYDPELGTWPFKNLPTYLKNAQAHDSSGYLPRSCRKIWKPGIIVWRVYDYCSGEFVGSSVTLGDVGGKPSVISPRDSSSRLLPERGPSERPVPEKRRRIPAGG